MRRNFLFFGFLFATLVLSAVGPEVEAQTISGPPQAINNLPDLVVKEIIFEPAPEKIRVRVMNQGTGASSACYLALMSMISSDASLSTKQRTWTIEIPALQAGKGFSNTIDVSPLTQAHGPWMAVVDRSNTVKEKNESNNRLTYTASGGPGSGGGALKPQLALMGAVTETAGGKEYSVTKLTIVNWEKFSSRFFTPAPHLPPCGQNKNSARSWLTIHRQDNGEQIYGYCALAAPVDLKDFSYATPKDKTPPQEVFVRLTDRATNTVYQSNCINAWSGIACGKL